MDSVVSKFHTLQHFFFILRKLITEGDLFSENSSDNSVLKYSSQGGFLTQPVFDSLPANVGGHPSIDNLKSQESFCYLLSEIAWPSIRKCLIEGKAFVDYSLCQVI